MEFAFGIGTLLSTASIGITTTKNIYNVMSKIFGLNAPDATDVRDALKKLDIEEHIELIDEMMNEIPYHEINSPALTKCVESIRDIKRNIEMELSEIYNKLAHNKSLWVMKYWRSYDCKSNLKNISIYKMNLESRITLLQIKYDLRNNLKAHSQTDNAKVDLRDSAVFTITEIPDVEVEKAENYPDISKAFDSDSMIVVRS